MREYNPQKSMINFKFEDTYNLMLDRVYQSLKKGLSAGLDNEFLKDHMQGIKTAESDLIKSLNHLFQLARWPGYDYVNGILELNNDYRNILRVHTRREWMIKNCGYAIPCREALKIIKKYGPLLEIGAGTGLWARLLSDIGCKIIATDPGEFPFNNKFYEIEKLYAIEALEKYPGMNVFCSWPSYKESWASESLEYVRDKLIYIGEHEGMSCANDKFFEILESEFTLIESYELPHWPIIGIDDNLYIYGRVK